jgi:excisionase family DNA binding protein
MNTANEVAATMSVTQAAKLLGIGRQTAYDLAAQGKLPGARRLGRRIIVSKRALERFLDEDSGVVTEGGNDIG